ncbi:MAG: transglycosylase SLT domain-containing protein [Gallionella sp.]
MKFLLYFLLLVTPPALADQGGSPQRGVLFTGDADFLAAHDAFLAGDTVKLGQFSQRLKNSPLEVYVRYYQLSLALKKLNQGPVPAALENAARSFLSRPEDTPVIDLLRGEWLKVLGKNQQWDLFDAGYPHLRNGDTELTCYALQSRRSDRESAVLSEARKLWFVGKEQPDDCKTLFDAALTAGIISKPDISRRLRLALEANNVTFAIKLSGQLGDEYADLPAMLKSAAADPDRYLRKLAAGITRTTNVADTPASHAHPASPIKSHAASPAESPASAVQAASAVNATPPAPPRGRFAWTNFWSQLGFGKADTPLAGNGGSTPPNHDTGAECDGPCADIYGDDSVPASGWNPGLSTRGQRIAALFAVERLAKQSTDLAAAHWKKIAGYFPPSEQQYGYGRLAYQAARNLDERALKWYRAAQDMPLDDQQSAWRVRAALRALDWPEVLTSVNAMGTEQQQESAWLYWKARALKALGKPAEARKIFLPLSGEYSFYGLLAGDEMSGTAVISQPEPVYKPDSQAIAAVSAMPGVQRTVALYRIGMRSDALEEWRWVVNNLNDRQLLTAAEIARRNKMYDRAIGAADKTVSEHDFSMRYPAPYRADLQEHLRKHGLDEAWVYGLMRQESRFATSAKSETGAAGLMQIMPSTARWVARKLGLKSYRTALIHELDTNLRIGTYYMKSVLSRAENNPVLASAAYNAGPSRALQWRGDKPLEGAIYAETIPYQETRDYVEKVMSNTAYYAAQFGDSPRSLKKRLGIVPAKPADNSPANTDGK